MTLNMTLTGITWLHPSKSTGRLGLLSTRSVGYKLAIIAQCGPVTSLLVSFRRGFIYITAHFHHDFIMWALKYTKSLELDCLLKSQVMPVAKKLQIFAFLSLCDGKPSLVVSPHKRTSSAEMVSMSWRHHVTNTDHNVMLSFTCMLIEWLGHCCNVQCAMYSNVDGYNSRKFL